jgi:chaperonin GroEL (HSP60 family)
MAVDAVLRLKKSGNLDAIQIIKVQGGLLEDSFLDEGIGMHTINEIMTALKLAIFYRW